MKKKSIAYFDFLNIAACLCVIGMHCNGIVHRFEDVPAWYVSMGVETLGYWAVPVFCMLSGATMMNYRDRYTTSQFLKRRLLRVGIPLLFWTALFYLWKRHTGEILWTGHRSFLNLLMGFGVEPVYWFFAPLLMIYLALPVLSKFAQDRALQRYVLAVGILSISVLPAVCSALELSYNSSFYFPVLGGYLLFPVLGWYLHNTEFKAWQKWIIYGLGLLSLAARWGHTVLTFRADGVANQLTWGYKNLPAVILSVAVFVLAKDICSSTVMQKPAVQKSLRWLSSASFGIYLIHIFVMNFIKGKFGVDVYSWLWLLAAPVGIYLLCLTVVKLLQKLPVGKYIFP